MKTKTGLFGKLMNRMGAAILVTTAVFGTAQLKTEAARAADYAAVFNATWYADHYPDLKNAYGTNATKLLNHFLAYGMSEGRQASAEFNLDAYKSRYSDLRDAFGNNNTDYYIHYIRYGKKEGRDASGTAASVSAPAQQPSAPAAQQKATNGKQPIQNGDNWQSIPGTSDPSYAKAAEVLQSLGWSITNAFNWSAGLTYYGHGKADMPEEGSPGTHWFANFGFDNRKGNCFVMAATFYEFAKLCGYSPRQIFGYVPRRSGGMGPHSWVEIDVDGETYVYDPDYTYGTGKNGFKIKYGQSGTWHYTDYARMSE
ncbi:MAG: transglutaminase-like domain-containing protein [Lachnospiraceae bacterium]|nr:transglutaminase-like domain-containing protein [Lachnospiraceae bacterium]